MKRKSVHKTEKLKLNSHSLNSIIMINKGSMKNYTAFSSAFTSNPIIKFIYSIVKYFTKNSPIAQRNCDFFDEFIKKVEFV